MDNKITIVTSPDDVLVDGFRILTFDLTQEQSSIISNVLKDSNLPDTIVYVYNIMDKNIKWLIDKKFKSSIIYFNAQSQDQTTVGYLAAQRNAYYFGDLRELSCVNTNQVISNDAIRQIMEVKANNDA